MLDLCLLAAVPSSNGTGFSPDHKSTTSQPNSSTFSSAAARDKPNPLAAAAGQLSDNGKSPAFEEISLVSSPSSNGRAAAPVPSSNACGHPSQACLPSQTADQPKPCHSVQSALTGIDISSSALQSECRSWQQQDSEDRRNSSMLADAHQVMFKWHSKICQGSIQLHNQWSAHLTCVICLILLPQKRNLRAVVCSVESHDCCSCRCHTEW